MDEPPRIAVIGAGRLARALARTWRERIVAVVGRTRSDAAEVARLASKGVRAAAVLEDVEQLEAIPASVVWIATSDVAVPIVVEKLAGIGRTWDGVAVVHSSGLLPLAVLGPLAARGAVAVGLHPNLSIVGDEPLPDSVLWGVAASGAEPEHVARWILGENARILMLDDDRRALYHAAASAAANFPVALFALTVELYRSAGLDERNAVQLTADFMSHAVERAAHLGASAAITGPVVRGDWPVVFAQTEAVIAAAPHLAPAFEELVRLSRQYFGPTEDG